MAKKIKLNIKNSQLTKALNLQKIKLSSAGKKLKKKVEKEEKEEAPKKRKARILPPVEKAAEKKKEEKKIEKKKIEKEIKESEKREIKEEKKKEEKPKKKVEVKEEVEISPKKKELPPKEKEEKFDKKKKLKKSTYKTFDTRDRLGLRTEEDDIWRKKRRAFKKLKPAKEKIPIIRPKDLSIRVPISIKDLAAAMKLKASELISKLLEQGVAMTLNDSLEDDTTIGLLGQEFDCNITIDRSEEEKLKITSKTIQEEIKETPEEALVTRDPIITFMGHVDHGKTSIIDRIRSSKLASFEAGAITQHIGAFTAKTKLGSITILDTPGHEAFTEIRSRGATVTDIVVLVIAGDEGMKEQTLEAMDQAKKASVPIVVAINKSDKEGFDPEKVYRQLADHELLPEAWGGTTITVNCSAVTGNGIDSLLEMVSLQAEILELKANPETRARGVILESEMHKGLGSIANILVQNGTLKLQDSIVFGTNWGKIKTMHDQYNKSVSSAGPSTPIKITGLSNLAEAGLEFIVLPSEKEAKDLAQKRRAGEIRQKLKSRRARSLEGLQKEEKRELPIIIRADMQGSLEALISAIKKLPSKKVEPNIVSAEVGEISESDIELSQASNAPIVGFHTRIESHAEPLIKKLKVEAETYDVIYHAIDAIKNLMIDRLDKIEEEKKTGEAKIKALFQSSHLGKIAGCLVTSGNIKRGQRAKVIREDEVVHIGKIGSIKRVAEDVKEVQKGVECGIILENFSDIKENDIIETYDISYLKPKL